MDSDTELEQPQGGNPSSRQKKGLSKKTLVILISVVVVLIIALGALAYKNSQDQNGATPTVSVSPVPSLVQTATQERIEDEGVTWLTPEKIEDQGLFEKSGVDSFYSSTDYYKVGKTSTGGEILLAVINIDEPRNDQPIHRILKNSDSYKRIVQNSADFSNDGYQPTKKLVNENSYVFKSLLADKVITKNQTDLISLQNPVFYYENKSETVEKKIASTKWGDMYLELGRSYSANDIDQQNQDKTTVLKIARYFVKLNDSTQLSYEVRPRFLRDDNTFDLDYKINKVSSYKYDKFETGGCGFGLGSFPYMTETESLKNNDIVGTKSSASLYGVSNTDNKTLSYAYTLYKSDQASGKVSLDEFASNYGFVYWTDDYGNTVGYLRSDYKPAIECGKPVVYLYPNKKTDFTVKVGAYVTKSDPMYDGFWQGTAYPGSKLVVSNKEYSSLFWEGIG